MIKFFRHIRKQLLSEGKISKYLKYALGEILLVVIGILIALQINNLNDTRKTKNSINNIYKIIYNDLQTDIKLIDLVIEDSKIKDSIIQRVLKNKMTFDDYLNCKSCHSIINSYPDIKLKERGLNLLLDKSAFLNSHQDSLSVLIMDFYNKFKTEIDVALREVTRDYVDNRHFFKNNKSWFEDSRSDKVNKEFIKYALESQDYRNRIISFQELYINIYVYYLKEYKKDALTILDEINLRIK